MDEQAIQVLCLQFFSLFCLNLPNLMLIQLNVFAFCGTLFNQHPLMHTSRPVVETVHSQFLDSMPVTFSWPPLLGTGYNGLSSSSYVHVGFGFASVL